jgi:uncharacterized membrane protein HdeD (DUF308 family)
VSQTTAASTTTTTTPRSRLRSLHLIRAAFSLVWVVLVLTTSHSLRSPDSPTTVAALLLVVYPLWDAVATVLDIRMTGARTVDRVSALNIAVDVIAAIAMALAATATISTTLLVFGVWAVVSGAIQLAVAIRRRGAVGGQWPMIISGGLSVVAGAGFAAMSASSTSGLSSVAGYSAFGAFWFLVAATALSRHGGNDVR